MPHPANVRGSDPRNYTLAAGLRLMFREKGSSLATDWKDLGDLEDVSFAHTIDRFEHFSTRRGQRALDRSIVSSRQMQLNVMLHEINFQNLKLAFGSDGSDRVDVLFQIQDSRIFVNPGFPGSVSLGQLDIVPGSVLVRNVLDEEVESKDYVENTDFSVDPNTGVITILDAPGELAVASEGNDNEDIHVFWEKDVETQKIEAWSGKELDGEARFMMINPDGISIIWEMPQVQIQTNGDIAFGDGTDLIGLPLTVQILAGPDGKFFHKHVIKEGELDLV